MIEVAHLVAVPLGDQSAAPGIFFTVAEIQKGTINPR